MFEHAMTFRFAQEDFEKYFFAKSTVASRSSPVFALFACFAVKIFHLQFCALFCPEEELIVSLSFAFLRPAIHFTTARSN
jgi:hypothetical protein